MKGKLIQKMQVIILLTLFALLTACDVTAYSNLSESTINEMIALLRNNGIQAIKAPGLKETWNLNVPDKDFARSIDILTVNGLPRDKYDNMGTVFTKDSMVSTPLEEKARMLYALSQELAGTIAQIDGVLSSRVHIVLPEVDAFGKKLSSSSASVFVKYRADIEFQEQVVLIKKLIENSVRDLAYENISVFLFPSAVSLVPPLPAENVNTIFGINSLYFWLVLFVFLAAIICLAVLLFLKSQKTKIELKE